jgi:hypothetical protein
LYRPVRSHARDTSRQTRHGSENRRRSFFDAATATDTNHWLAIIAIAVAVLMPVPAQADQWSLLINGKAIHLDALSGSDLNEDNWGALAFNTTSI